MMASISSVVRGIASESTVQPSSVMSRSSSMRMPIASSSMYRPGSSVMTMPGASSSASGPVASCVSMPR